MFVILILLLVLVPSFWSKYKNELLYKYRYKEYTECNNCEVDIIDGVVTINIDRDDEAKAYVHMINKSYEVLIIDIHLNSGENEVVLPLNDAVYIYMYIDDIEQEKLIILN